MQENRNPIIQAEERIVRTAVAQRKSIAHRFPLVFGLLTTFGFVCTLYGFEKLIDRVDFLINNPWILLLVGVSTLVATGVAYKKLN